MSIAFLVVDVQQAFFDNPRFKEPLMVASDYINEVSGYFRESGFPVIHIQDLNGGGGPGNPGFEVAKEITHLPEEIYIHKSKGNAFWNTDLEKVLKDLKVEHVIVSGFAVPYCVLSTYLGAEERDFGVSLLQNGIAGVDMDALKQISTLRNVVNYKFVKFCLENIKK